MDASAGHRRQRNSRTVVRQALALGLLAVGFVGFSATAPASAAGTSNVEYNCYTQWWNTAWAQKCGTGGADFYGYYQSSVSCSAQGTRTLTVQRGAGSTGTVSGPDCTFSVSNGKMDYLGYL
jgi:hypothetical protein